jgi:predicted ATPase
LSDSNEFFRSLLVLLAYRPSVLACTTNSFLPIHSELKQRHLIRELALGFLGEVEIREILLAEFRKKMFPSNFGQLLFQRTEGHPLFVVDIIRYLRDKGIIAVRNDMWSLD